MTVEASFRVELPAPLDIAGSLALFQRSGDDLIDRWDGVRLVRALATGGTCVPFVASAIGANPEVTRTRDAIASLATQM